MNQFKTVLERQENTRLIIERELDRLINKVYNPITNKSIDVVIPVWEILPTTAFIIALTEAEKRISASAIPCFQKIAYFYPCKSQTLTVLLPCSSLYF